MARDPSSPAGGRRWRPSPDTAIALAALFIALGGASFAAVHSQAGSSQITACADPAGGGPLQLLTSGSCPSGQTALSWNQQGPQGPPGLPGSANDAQLASGSVPALPAAKKVNLLLNFDHADLYLVEGYTDVIATSATSGKRRARCLLSDPKNVLDSQVQSAPKGEKGLQPPIHLSAVVRVSTVQGTALLLTPAFVTFKCSQNGSLRFDHYYLSATPIKIKAPKP